MTMDHKLLLLGLLRRQGMHGYQLFEFIESALSACTDLKKPTAYYLLNKMAEDGWVAETQQQEGNRPPRRVYQLTPAGEAEFQQLLRTNLASYRAVYFPGDFGLAFLDEIQPAEATLLLEQRRHVLESDLAQAREVPVHGGSLQLVIEHRAHHLQAELAWLDGIMARLSSSNIQE
jgi:DNA-binding PadR family transcriptional regulator